MKLCVWDKDAEKLITSEDVESRNISIKLDGRILWDGVDMSKDLKLIID